MTAKSSLAICCRWTREFATQREILFSIDFHEKELADSENAPHILWRRQKLSSV
jgi:hypothetical protein